MDVDSLAGRTIESVEVRSRDDISLWFTDGTAVSVGIDRLTAGTPLLVIERPIEERPPCPIVPLAETPFDHPVVVIDYTNWRGKRSTYTVCPLTMFEGRTQYHGEHQRLLRAFVPAKRAIRDFAVKDVHSVAPAVVTRMDIPPEGVRSDDTTRRIFTQDVTPTLRR